MTGVLIPLQAIGDRHLARIVQDAAAAQAQAEAAAKVADELRQKVLDYLEKKWGPVTATP